MRILVDTQIFIWIFIEPYRFGKEARSFLENSDANQFYLSDVSPWEAAIKYGLGKLKLPEIPEIFFADRVRQAGYKHLRIDLRHVTRVHSLPQNHRDPFDRLLITQAMLEEMTIISDDRVFRKYDVETLTIKDLS
ncbi:MAG TPA: type II toxin-antitoxin system VapC family toxin [Pyrinomonadaceae bacterium]|nr:type II toxin-antitoxin system VapC family toxin [Pyrinomonadaceae bacterium]